MATLGMRSQLKHDRSGDGSVSILNPDGAASILLVCEHASSYIPAELDNLGLSVEDRLRHIAWDPGAYAVSAHLSALLDAPLVASNVSRLVYDCNRPPESPDAMLTCSEIFDIPGNRDLSDADRTHRVATYYRPFETAVRQTLKAIGPGAILITIHSFTPQYRGTERAVQLGILHDIDTRLADAMLDHASAHTDLSTQRNEPYGPEDGVTHTLKHHGIKNRLPNVMLEIRNDLISMQPDADTVATMLNALIRAACDTCGFSLQRQATA